MSVFLLCHVLSFSQSALIDDASAKKLKVIVTEQNVVENIPFMLIGVSIILGIIFMFLICQRKIPEVSIKRDLSGFMLVFIISVSL